MDATFECHSDLKALDVATLLTGSPVGGVHGAVAVTVADELTMLLLFDHSPEETLTNRERRWW